MELFKDSFVDGWHDIVTEVEKLWVDLVTDIAVGMAKAMVAVRDALGDEEGAQAWADKVPELIRSGKLEKQDIGDKARRAEAERHATRAADDLAAALAKSAAEMKLREDVAKARPAPREAGPMPHEVAKALAVEGLGAARGQLGGYGAGFALGVGGETVQKQQLAVLEEIAANTAEGGGIRGD